MVPLYIRLEAITVICLSLFIYFDQGGVGWWLIPLFFIPDLFMLGYLVDRRIGAAVYNVAHNYVIPVLLGLIGIYINEQLLLQLAAAWIFHIGVDRTFGYGLKYKTNFKDTHLQKIYQTKPQKNR